MAVGKASQDQYALKASRDPVDRITDEMLTRPLGKLTPAERGMIRRAINGKRSEEFLERVAAVRRAAR